MMSRKKKKKKVKAKKKKKKEGPHCTVLTLSGLPFVSLLRVRRMNEPTNKQKIPSFTALATSNSKY